MAHLGVRLRHRLEALHVPKVEARRVHHHARAHGVPHELRDARTARALRVFGALRASAKLFWVPSGTEEAARVGLQKAPKESTHWSSLSQSKSRSWQRFQRLMLQRWTRMEFSCDSCSKERSFDRLLRYAGHFSHLDAASSSVLVAEARQVGPCVRSSTPPLGTWQSSVAYAHQAIWHLYELSSLRQRGFIPRTCLTPCFEGKDQLFHPKLVSSGF